MSQVQYEQKIEFVRALVSQNSLDKTRKRLIDILSEHINKDFTMIELVLVKEVFEIGVLTIRGDHK